MVMLKVPNLTAGNGSCSIDVDIDIEIGTRKVAWLPPYMGFPLAARERVVRSLASSPASSPESTPASSPAPTTTSFPESSVASASAFSPQSAVFPLPNRVRPHAMGHRGHMVDQACSNHPCNCKRLLWTFAFIAACIWRGKAVVLLALAFGKGLFFTSIGLLTFAEDFVCLAFLYFISRLWLVVQIAYYFKGTLSLVSALVLFHIAAPSFI
ncbi:hypothetical protein FRC08_015719 [Ceratobasidium sp. 394]|nr:hypothetical protein FRC08_015719 [Ceratobasidium sp. 394]KAG9094406.1 hypothetical protein FS749_012534 [Ceratobasidium sp. UAMH 11750]